MGLRLGFMGSAEFSVASLRACVAAGHDVAAVVTQPGRAGDRGRAAPRPVADAAAGLGLPLLQPERVREPAVERHLAGLHLDALVVAAYGQILPAGLLDLPRLGAINVHASLLPRWRGASPVHAAIMAGDERTGVSIMRMDPGLDTGPVYAMRDTPIGERETTPELSARLAGLGAGLLVEVLAALERGEAEPVAQPEVGVTHAARLTRADGVVDWARRDAVEVDRRVRGLLPWPGTTARLAGQEVRLLAGGVDGETAGAPGGAEPGTVVAVRGGSAVVATRAGGYRVDTVQPPGRRAMDAAAYLRGRRG